MRHLLSAFALVAALAAPAALHADPITGQFSLMGTVTNTGTALNFSPDTAKTGMGTQTGDFATLLSDGEMVTSGPSTITYSPYVPDSVVVGIGAVSATIDSIVATDFVLNGNRITGFAGTVTFSAMGFDNTPGVFSFSTQDSGPVTFSATGMATSPVPEPSSLMLFGTGALGLAGLVSKKLIA